MVDGPGHHLHHLGGVQHANLHRVNTDVVQHRLQLRLQKRSWNALNGLHALGVLRGQGRQRGHAVAAQRRESFQVGLNASAAAAVRARDAQHPGILARESVYVHDRDYGGGHP